MGAATVDVGHAAIPGSLSSSELMLIGCSLLAMGVVCVVYTRGILRIRLHEQGWNRHRWRTVAFASAVVLTLLVSLPPLSEALEERLSTHMVQHMTYIVLIAPLFAIAAPGQPMLAGLPVAVRRPITTLVHRIPATVVLAPHVAWTVHIAALWLWHLPSAYDLALASEPVHELEHLCFLSTAWLFWWHIATISRRRLRGPVALFYVSAAILPGAALGALLTFSNQTLYPAQAATAAAAGENPLFDQRIAGLVMWIPLDYAYLAVAVWLFSRWFRGLAPGSAATYKPDKPLALPGEVKP